MSAVKIHLTLLYGNEKEMEWYKQTHKRCIISSSVSVLCNEHKATPLSTFPLILIVTFCVLLHFSSLSSFHMFFLFCSRWDLVATQTCSTPRDDLLLDIAAHISFLEAETRAGPSVCGTINPTYHISSLLLSHPSLNACAQRSEMRCWMHTSCASDDRKAALQGGLCLINIKHVFRCRKPVNSRGNLHCLSLILSGFHQRLADLFLHLWSLQAHCLVIYSFNNTPILW